MLNDVYQCIGEDADKYGPCQAMILSVLKGWQRCNLRKGANFKDGHCWTYDTIDEYKKIFYFFSVSQIARYLRDLEEKGAIKSANYNKKAYDRTKWYTVLNYGLTDIVTPIIKEIPQEIDTLLYPDENVTLYKFEQCNVQKCTMDRSNLNNHVNKFERPIPMKIYNEDKEYICPDAFNEVIGHLNDLTGAKYRHDNKQTKSLIQKLVKDGFTVDQIKLVNELKVSQWAHDLKMKSYLRPKTLYGSNFHSYLEEAENPIPLKRPNEKEGIRPKFIHACIRNASAGNFESYLEDLNERELEVIPDQFTAKELKQKFPDEFGLNRFLEKLK